MWATCGWIHQNQNGHIISFSAYYAKVDNNDGTTIVGDWKTKSSHNQHVYIDGLELWTHYAVKCAGATIIGPGPNTTYEIVRTHEDCKIFFPFFQFLKNHKSVDASADL